MNTAAKETWEYLVQDFLEVRCMLKEKEQDFLLNFLKGKGPKAESIKIHHAFSIDDCLVVIDEDARSKKRLIYHPEKQLIVE